MRLAFQRSPLIPVLIVVAIAAILVAILVAIAIPSFVPVKVIESPTKTRIKLEGLAAAILQYRSDNGTLPPAVPLSDFGLNADATTVDFSKLNVATPLNLFTDRMAPAANIPYCYHRSGNSFIVYGAGPDGDYDLPATTAFDGSTSQPSQTLIAGPWTYDPTNGSESSGDIWEVRQ